MDLVTEGEFIRGKWKKGKELLKEPV